MAEIMVKLSSKTLNEFDLQQWLDEATAEYNRDDKIYSDTIDVEFVSPLRVQPPFQMD